MSSLVIRQALVPMLVFYIVIMAVLAVGLRMSRRRAAGSPPGEGQASGAATRDTPAALWPKRLRPLAARGPGWLRVVTQYAYTAVGGYLLILVVDVAYYYFVARVTGNFIESAVTGGALLLGLSAPVFLALSWLARRWT
jgi:Family of unknown function (DUF6256)